jgi:deoxyribodipyrimidine photolyase-related protein
MMLFRRLLPPPSASESLRKWFFVPYDQLSSSVGPLGRLPAEDVGIVLVESLEKGRRRPYHKQKLLLILSNMRSFALEQAERGAAVRYLATTGSYAEVLERQASELGPLSVMRPAERELRLELAPLVASGAIKELPHEGWLSTPEDFRSSCGAAPPWRMDSFYRHLRRKTGILMEGKAPAGGRFSHDSANRKPWRGLPKAPSPPRFTPSRLTLEAAADVERIFPEHPGRCRPESIPATAADALLLWDWAKRECLPFFGPFEDAMSSESRTLFHTLLSPLVNILRLPPRQLLADVLELGIPLQSKEGFVRQLLGWREFVRHVHSETDGFRSIGERGGPEGDRPGTAGWDHPISAQPGYGGSLANHFALDSPLPPAYWGTPSGLQCLDRCVSDVMEHGYTHHIPRLMVLSNLSNLLDVEPRQLADWFWCAFIDAYDWVVEPNVLGMGTFAAGETMSTKPYLCGSAYIAKMSDHCGSCAFHPKRDCPVASLYWAFLGRHADKLRDNFRMKLAIRNLERRSEEKKSVDRAVFNGLREILDSGGSATPQHFERWRENGEQDVVSRDR